MVFCRRISVILAISPEFRMTLSPTLKDPWLIIERPEKMSDRTGWSAKAMANPNNPPPKISWLTSKPKNIATAASPIKSAINPFPSLDNGVTND